MSPQRFSVVHFLVALAAASLACGSGTKTPASPPIPSVSAMATSEASAAATTATPPATSTPSASELIGSRTPPDSLPDAENVLRTGQSVSFKVCDRTTDWQRPSRQVMKVIYKDLRFGDGARPYPLDYASYLESVYYVELPMAISANIDWTAMSGFSLGGGQSEHLCDRPDVAGLVQQFGAPGKSSLPFYQDVDLVGYHAVDMKRDGVNLVVRVEPAPDTHESAYFPYPADPSFFQSSIGFESVQVVDGAGKLLHAESRVAFVSWSERLTYDSAGRLSVAVLWGYPPLASTQIDVPPGQEPMTLYWGLGGSMNPAVAPLGSIIALDSRGAELRRWSWSSTPGFWQPLAHLQLPPDTNRLRIETAATSAINAGLYDAFVLIADDQPLPLP